MYLNFSQFTIRYVCYYVSLSFKQFIYICPFYLGTVFVVAPMTPFAIRPSTGKSLVTLRRSIIFTKATNFFFSVYLMTPIQFTKKKAVRFPPHKVGMFDIISHRSTCSSTSKEEGNLNNCFLYVQPPFKCYQSSIP